MKKAIFAVMSAIVLASCGAPSEQPVSDSLNVDSVAVVKVSVSANYSIVSQIEADSTSK